MSALRVEIGTALFLDSRFLLKTVGQKWTQKKNYVKTYFDFSVSLRRYALSAQGAKRFSRAMFHPEIVFKSNFHRYQDYSELFLILATVRQENSG